VVAEMNWSRLRLLARIVLTNREHIIAVEARDKGLMGMLLSF
jgi:DNA end-binding protein Ku